MSRPLLKPHQRGFTLMEVVVAATIFAIAASAILSLFNYTLKINRRADALRQASQGLRNLSEFITKEVRNGQIDYSGLVPNCTGTSYLNAGQTWLGLVNSEGTHECFYLNNNKLYYYKSTLSAPEVISPSNFTVNYLNFLVRPLSDPYTTGNIKTQPFVTLVGKFTATLPTGETTQLNYQTSVSTDKFDIPNQ